MSCVFQFEYNPYLYRLGFILLSLVLAYFLFAEFDWRVELGGLFGLILSDHLYTMTIARINYSRLLTIPREKDYVSGAYTFCYILSRGVTMFENIVNYFRTLFIASFLKGYNYLQTFNKCIFIAVSENTIGKE